MSGKLQEKKGQSTLLYIFLGNNLSTMWKHCQTAASYY